MKVVIVVSPDYLENIFHESDKYSFCVQGYGDFDYARSRLIYTNAVDVLGFVILATDLPTRGSKDYEAMLRFVAACNLMETGKKFILASKGPVAVPWAKDYKNLRFRVLDNIEMITDTVINKDIFGSILLDNYKPYKLDPEKPQVLGDYSPVVQTYRPLISTALYAVFNQVHPMETLRDTILNDTVITQYSNNAVITVLREIRICVAMNESWSEFGDKFWRLIENSDSKLRGIYIALFMMITDGEILS